MIFIYLQFIYNFANTLSNNTGCNTLLMFLFSLYPGLNSNIAGKLAGGSFISKVLLANADALCAAASPLVEDDIPA